jgi:hypothetical protein
MAMELGDAGGTAAAKKTTAAKGEMLTILSIDIRI